MICKRPRRSNPRLATGVASCQLTGELAAKLVIKQGTGRAPKKLEIGANGSPA
jgi:hypothetical protein